MIQKHEISIKQCILILQILLARNKRKSFLREILIVDVKWIYFNNPYKKKSWGHAPTSTVNFNTVDETKSRRDSRKNPPTTTLVTTCGDAHQNHLGDSSCLSDFPDILLWLSLSIDDKLKCLGNPWHCHEHNKHSIDLLIASSDTVSVCLQQNENK